MAEFGHLSLIAAFCFAGYSVVASLLSGRTRLEPLARSAENAVCAVLGFLILASIALEVLIFQGDFSVQYVWGHSNRAMSPFYKFAALWGGQAGSLLFWSVILNGYVTACILINRHRNRSLMPYAVFTLMSVALFFILLNLFIANPFDQHAVAEPDGTREIITPPDGRGLNPLLQHPAMLIHPPILYTGYIGFVVPFAFGIAAMMRRELGELWIKTTRRWTLFSWLFLGVGILLGGRWAYVELGWGGYWGWDPVENASLMPWLTGTAFLHSVMIQEKRRMLKVWNMVLIILTFGLCLLGTFLTRSGAVSSVHAFAQSKIGPVFAVFIALLLTFSFGLLLKRLPYLKSDNQLDSVVSRESAFLFNNLVLLAAMFAILWGTLLPVISEWFQGEKITVGPPFFNKVTIPIGLVILFLTGVGPLIAWRKNSPGTLRRNLIVPSAASLAMTGVLLLFRVWNIYALVCLALCAFVLAAVTAEFLRGARARQKSTGENLLSGLANLTLRNKRRYGGYIVHLAVVLLFVGFAGNAFNADAQETMGQGDEFQIRSYVLRAEAIQSYENDNYVGQAVRLGVFQKGRRIATLQPERRFYKTSEQQTTEIGLRSSLKEDLYVVFAGTQEEKAVVQAYVNPLVNWVWIGGFLLILGTLIAMLPDALEKRQRPISIGRPERVREREKIPATAVGLFLLLYLCVPSAYAVTPAKTSLTNPEQVAVFKEVSRELTCQCGCQMNLSQCSHANCPWGIPARLEIEANIKKGYLRDEIIQRFLARYGTQVRAAPPAEGFHLVYWVMPFLALLVGGGFASFRVARWRQRVKRARQGSFEIDPEMRARIERELERF